MLFFMGTYLVIVIIIGDLSKEIFGLVAGWSMDLSMPFTIDYDNREPFAVVYLF